VIILLEHSSQVMSLVFGAQVKEIQVSEEEQNGDNKQSKYSSLHSEQAKFSREKVWSAQAGRTAAPKGSAVTSSADMLAEKSCCAGGRARYARPCFDHSQQTQHSRSSHSALIARPRASDQAN
jgi:hypothetical protein